MGHPPSDSWSFSKCMEGSTGQKLIQGHTQAQEHVSPEHVSPTARAAVLGADSGAPLPGTFLWGFCPLTSEGTGHKLLSFDNVPSALVNLNPTCPVFNRKGTVEVQLLATAGAPQASEPCPHTGTAGGHTPTWDTELGRSRIQASALSGITQDPRRRSACGLPGSGPGTFQVSTRRPHQQPSLIRCDDCFYSRDNNIEAQRGVHHPLHDLNDPAIGRQVHGNQSPPVSKMGSEAQSREADRHTEGCDDRGVPTPFIFFPAHTAQPELIPYLVLLFLCLVSTWHWGWLGLHLRWAGGQGRGDPPGSSSSLHPSPLLLYPPPGP